MRITSVDEFKNFVNDVNPGTDDYSGTTVFLDTDLSLSGESFQPIGNTSRKYFLGTFDGQGHIISDLKINSTSEYTGLFGFSRGLTIRNVVLDSSCSIISSYSGSDAYVFVGGIIGYCDAKYEQCIIENNVNMADATFGGSISASSGYLYLGGIVGEFYSYSYPSYVKNCANYGSITHLGTSYGSYIVGVVGRLYGSSSNHIYNHLYNCLNYGTITHSGKTSSSLYIGGIAGESNYASIENCVSAGKISIQSTSSKSYIGSIVGNIYLYTSIKYCYYTSELGGYNLYGRGTPESSSYTLSYDSVTLELSESVSVGNYTGTSLVDVLNAAADYYFLRDYSKWLINKEKKTVTFIINSRTSPFTMNYQIILLPSPPSRGSLIFDGWYDGSEYTHPLESFEVTEDMELYSRFEKNTNNYTITFDARKEYAYFAPITAQFGAAVSLPSKFVEGQCGVAFWETEYGDDLGLNLTMPAHNFTLYAVWKCTHLVTPDDFIEFANKVNSGKYDFNGITVLFDSDLSFSDKIFEPIGNYYYYFRGTFDGQGHIISDLKINTTSSRCAGLFGRSEGLTIRNVVLDSSCSITSSYSGSGYVGGIIGECTSSKKECIIENSVNMAGVTFSGNIDDYSLYLGGIVGELFSYSYPSYVKNCANYGSVTHSRGSSYSYIGGIVGKLYCLAHIYKYIYNCINYGAITYSGTTAYELYLGGIVGYSQFAYIENCVSAGKITTQSTPSEDSFIGSVAGCVDSDSKTYINNSYYTSDVGEYPVNGSGSPIIDVETSQAEVNATLVNKLNSYASKSNWNKWLLNANNVSILFKVNGNAGFTVNSQVILIPDLVDNDERSFKGWYTDEMLTSPFTGNEVNTKTTLHGVFCGSSNYTVTFDADGGNDLNEGEDKVVAFNSTYGTLPEAEKPEYVFMGWFTEKANGTKVTSETIVTTPNNHTLYAHWEEITNYVKVIFSTKGLTKNEAEEILKRYTNAEFTIDKYEVNELGEIIVIAKFTNKEDAEKFVGAINKLGGNCDIKANFVFSNDNGSFSSKLYPTLLTIVMLLL